MLAKDMIKALRSGQRVYGTLIVSSSPKWPQAVNGIGLDFVFIDTEHIALDRAELSWMCHAYRSLGLSPLVRIPSPDPYIAAEVLDGGACGIIAPYVETVEQVIALQGAVKLRPLKGSRLRSIMSGEERMEPALEAYVQEHNAGNMLIVNVESRPALEAIDSIVAVPGLDAVLIGPHDLSCSLGVPEQYKHSVFDQAVRTIIHKARMNGKGAGIHFWAGIEQEIGWIGVGANLIVHSADITAFADAMRADVMRLREHSGDCPRLEKTASLNI